MSNLVVLKKSIADPKTMTQLKFALPEHITPEKFQRVAITALNNNPDIANCSTESVMNSLMKCAQDGLLPDGRDAALVKFKTTCQYIPMVGGLIKRMKNSGELSTISAAIVYEHDEFDFVMGDNECLTHKPKLLGDRGKPILAYAIAKFKDGGIQREVMTVAEIEKVRSVSRTKDTGPWVQWWDEMAKKTVIHRLAKRVPTSSDIESMINRDVKVMMTGEDENEPEPKKSLVDSINEAIDIESSEVEEPPAELPAPCQVCGGKGMIEDETGKGPCPKCAVN